MARIRAKKYIFFLSPNDGLGKRAANHVSRKAAQDSKTCAAKNGFRFTRKFRHAFSKVRFVNFELIFCMKPGLGSPQRTPFGQKKNAWEKLWPFQKMATILIGQNTGNTKPFFGGGGSRDGLGKRAGNHVSNFQSKRRKLALRKWISDIRGTSGTP